MRYLEAVKRTQIIAHRGARSLAPENTLAAAQKGYEAGADMWETDVGVTADGVLILFHDDSLKRTTNAAEVYPGREPWTFTEFSFDEIERLDAGGWFNREDPFGQIAAGRVSPEDQASYEGLRVPTVEEALRFTKERDWVVNIELKKLPPPLEDFPVVPRFHGPGGHCPRAGPPLLLPAPLARRGQIAQARGRGPGPGRLPPRPAD